LSSPARPPRFSTSWNGDDSCVVPSKAEHNTCWILGLGSRRGLLIRRRRSSEARDGEPCGALSIQKHFIEVGRGVVMDRGSESAGTEGWIKPQPAPRTHEAEGDGGGPIGAAGEAVSGPGRELPAPTTRVFAEELDDGECAELGFRQWLRHRTLLRDVARPKAALGSGVPRHRISA
jgi:hypothetical protein